jgi:hypothetical protein
MGIESLGYQGQTSTDSVPGKNMADEQLRELLAELISSSTDLNVRVWLDGIYTDFDNSQVQGDWMKGREVYFKVEGKVDTSKKSVDQPEGGQD